MIESLAPDLEQAHARAGAMALSLIGILGQAFELQGRAVQPSFCIGVAGFQGLERSVDEMRQCVELALGEAQRPGTQPPERVRPAAAAHVRERAALEVDIRMALNRPFLIALPAGGGCRGPGAGGGSPGALEAPGRGLIPPGPSFPPPSRWG
jgi:predicted signal transduction protein with EAL and GGDEF domain